MGVKILINRSINGYKVYQLETTVELWMSASCMCKALKKFEVRERETRQIDYVKFVTVGIIIRIYISNKGDLIGHIVQWHCN